MTIESGDLPVVVDNSQNAAATAKQGAYDQFHAQAYGGKVSPDTSGKTGGANDLDAIISQGQDPNYFGPYPWRNPHDNPINLPDITLTPTPTKEETTDAEKQFDKKISSMIPGADQELLKKVGHAMLEGDPKALAAALKDIKDPEKLKAVVKEINRMMKDLGTDAELAVGPDGHVLMYSKSGSVAIDIDPAKGQVVGERPIEVHGNTVVLEGGTVLNGDPDADAKNIGNGAVGRIEHPYTGQSPIWNPYEEPTPLWPRKPHVYDRKPLFPDDNPLFEKLDPKARPNNIILD